MGCGAARQGLQGWGLAELRVSHLFRYGGTAQSLTLKLPVTINKFFQPTEMAAQDFFQRWKQLSL